MAVHKVLPTTIFIFSTILCLSVNAETRSLDRLLRIPYQSVVTEEQREFLTYLPVGYEDDEKRKWPVMLFLHGHGERGNGKDELDYVMNHGPLMEAWIQRRPLPFIIISPQLPMEFGIEGVNDWSRGNEKPRRLKHGVPKRNVGFKSDLAIQRTDAEDFVDGPYSRFDPYPVPGRIPQGWARIDKDLLLMVDKILSEFRADPERVYLTGLSYGGFGTFDMAARYPERWAAIAPIVGTGDLEHAEIISKARIPIWMFGGGKDTVVKPHWLYQMAAALESAGHPALRFTVHEDMDHDAWKRVYEGEDLYNWLLSYTLKQRP